MTSTAQSRYLDLSYEADDRMLVLRLRGFWDREAVDDFDRRVTELFSSVAARGDRRGRVLVDLTQFKVQSGDIVDRIAAIVRVVARTVAWFAVVRSASALQQRQLERVLDASRTRVFGDEAAAMAWISNPGAGTVR